MRYKTLVQQKLVNVNGSIQMIDTALSKGDVKKASEFLENLRHQLEEIDHMIGIEPDDFENQFKP